MKNNYGGVATACHRLTSTMRIAVWRHAGTSTRYADAIGIKASEIPPAAYHDIYDLTSSELGRQQLKKMATGVPVRIST
jgi:hypothetical protein